MSILLNSRSKEVDRKTMKLPADLHRGLKIAAAVEGVTMVELIKKMLEERKENEK